MNTEIASKLENDAVRMPPNAGKGRVKGVPNKVTKQLKEMILGALDGAGGQDYLIKQATENPGPFMTLLGKVLPTTLANDTENPINLTPGPELESRIAELLGKIPR